MTESGAEPEAEPEAEPPAARGELFVLLRGLSESADNLAYLVLHKEATTHDLGTVARECSAMSAALRRYAAPRQIIEG